MSAPTRGAIGGIGRQVGGSTHPGQFVDVLIESPLFPNMIAQSQQVHAASPDLFGHLCGETGTTGSVLRVDYYQDQFLEYQQITQFLQLLL